MNNLHRYFVFIILIAILIIFVLLRFFHFSNEINLQSNIKVYRKGIRTKRVPTALIIGAPKCGSTGLREFLGIHPGICKLNHAEPNFFNLIQNYKQGVQWYRNLMPRSYPNQITIDKSPSYFRNDKAPSRVFQLNPNMKLILILRDPVLRVISHFAHLKAEELKFFGKKGVTIEEEIFDQNGQIRIKTTKQKYSDFLSITEDFRNSLISDSLYFFHLKRWLQYFNSSQFLFVNGHEFIKNPYNEVIKVEKFLELKPFFKREHFIFDNKKKFYCLSGQLYNKTKNQCLDKKKGRPHPNIDPVTINKIRKYLKPQSIKLFQFLKIMPFWEI